MEAQRLISVSLGKIAQSRGQRGGASLYKNLLVSTVLHKARHAFMVENFSAMLQKRAEQKETSLECDVDEPVSVRPATPAPNLPVEEPVSDRPMTPAPSLSVSEPVKSEEKENQSPQESDSENKENCAKCLKRRNTDVQSPSPSAGLQECSPNKRIKQDVETSNDSNNNNATYTTLTNVTNYNSMTSTGNTQQHEDTPHEPMQTEQISSLVSRFNSGLSGLLAASSGVDSDYSSSCATQVATFSDNVGSRPAIALTV